MAFHRVFEAMMTSKARLKAVEGSASLYIHTHTHTHTHIHTHTHTYTHTHTHTHQRPCATRLVAKMESRRHEIDGFLPGFTAFNKHIHITRKEYLFYFFQLISASIVLWWFRFYYLSIFWWLICFYSLISRVSHIFLYFSAMLLRFYLSFELFY